MSARTRKELEQEVESLRSRIALQDQVIARLLATSPAPAVVPMPYPYPVPAPTMPAPNPWLPVAPFVWPIITCQDVPSVGTDGVHVRTFDYRGAMLSNEVNLIGPPVIAYNTTGCQSSMQ